MPSKHSSPTLDDKLSWDGVSSQRAVELYRKLLLARRCEEKIRQEYFKDEMKTPVHLGVGGEAISVGVVSCIPAGTQTFGTYRNHALYLSVTEDTDGFFGELYGKASGGAKGKAGSMHLSAPEKGLMATSAVVGTTIPLAVGAAWANRYRGSKNPVVSFFGDGAMEEGAFWESLNFACLKKLRLLFVCEDNGLAIHTSTQARQGFRSIPEALQGFRCSAASGNGSDLLEVTRLTRQVLDRMEQEEQPGFLHLTYCRFLEHVGPLEDFEVGYRKRPTPTEWEALDPVRRLERDLERAGVSLEELQLIQKAVDEKIEASVLSAKQAVFAGPDELYEDVWA